MNIEHVAYFYPLFVVGVSFYFIGRFEGIREGKQQEQKRLKEKLDKFIEGKR